MHPADGAGLIQESSATARSGSGGQDASHYLRGFRSSIGASRAGKMPAATGDDPLVTRMLLRVIYPFIGFLARTIRSAASTKAPMNIRMMPW